MDVISWVWIVLFVISVMILFWGIIRIRASAMAKQTSPLGLISQEGTPPTLEGFGEARLLQDLGHLQSQRSFYDRFLDWVARRFTFWQFKMLVSSWRRFYVNVGEAVGTQTDFFRKMSERSNISLGNQKTRSTIFADTEEEKTRGARARQERKELTEPKPFKEPSKEREDPLERATRERIKKRELIEKMRAGEHKHIDKTMRDPERRREEHERVDNKWDMELQRLTE